LGPIPNPQSPIPNPQSPIPIYEYELKYNLFKKISKNYLSKLKNNNIFII